MPLAKQRERSGGGSKDGPRGGGEPKMWPVSVSERVCVCVSFTVYA